MDAEDSASTFENRFKATRTWNGVLKKFRNSMPLKRHRRFMYFYENSFTGKEAVDFLMDELPLFYSEEKEVTRLNCRMLLEKFIDVGLFLPVRGKRSYEDSFKEDEVFRFSDVPLERVIGTPILARRASSFKERISSGTDSCNRDFSKISRFQAANETRVLDERLANAATSLSSSRSLKIKSFRLSSSHGNLKSLVSIKLFDSVSATVSNKVPLSLEFEKPGDVNFPTRNAFINNKDNLYSDEIMTEQEEVGKTHAETKTTLSLRSFGKVVQNAAEQETSLRLPERRKKMNCETYSRFSPVRVKRRDIDVHRIWKEALLDRLRKTLCVTSLNGIIEHSFFGNDIKWNCENTDIREIVEVINEKDNLSTYLLAMMPFLTQCSFDQKLIESSAEMERNENIFENICDHFSKERGMLPGFLATAILNIISLIKDRSRNKPLKSLSSQNSSITTSSAYSFYSKCETTGKADTTDSASISTMSDKKLVNLGEEYDALMVRTQHERDFVPHSQSPFSSISYVTTNAATKLTSFSPRLKTPRLGFSPLVTDIAKEDETDLIESVALVLLTLVPTIYGRLHCLLWFMEKICRNRCLKLNSNGENRYVVLERLSKSVLSSSALMSPMQCLHLVTFLVDNQDEIFTVPKCFKTEVKNVDTDDHDGEEIKHNRERKDVKNDQLHESYQKSIEPNKNDQERDYEVEMEFLTANNIPDTETVAPGKRKKQLRQFKKTFPEIYPNGSLSPKVTKPRTPSILNRLRNLNFRQ